jgi:peptide/nickel transport system substrate-binding protein
MHASLVRLNRATGQLEPRLATEWTGSPDGLTWTLKLRRNVAFSDGAPFTSADVLFSFAALYDKRAAGPLGDSLRVDGRPLAVRALDSHTVVLTLPAAYAPGLSLLDSLPILPQHKLAAALDSGTFAQAWSATTDPLELVGLGPFVLEQYVPGQRLVFARNRRFWRRDDAGRLLPYLDELELQIVPEQNAEVLRLQAGEVDLVTDKVRPEDLAALEDLRDRGQIALSSVGVSISPDMLWFNLDPKAKRAHDRAWLQRDELRRAISHAVDRRAIVNTVYLGAAESIYGPITPGHGDWFLPDLPRTEHDPARARALLASIGLTDRDGDGGLEDTAGRPARFAISTQKGHTLRERSASIIQQHLKQIGLTVDVVPIERNALIGQWSTGDYDAIFFAIEFDSFDPARNMEFWLSSGQFHFWHPEQAKPATAWEARIDDLVKQQARALDPAARRRLFADVQRILAEHLPVLYFAAPKVIVATSSRVAGATPSVLSPSILWNAEMLSIAPSAAGPTRK